MSVPRCPKSHSARCHILLHTAVRPILFLPTNCERSETNVSPASEATVPSLTHTQAKRMTTFPRAKRATTLPRAKRSTAEEAERKAGVRGRQPPTITKEISRPRQVSEVNKTCQCQALIRFLLTAENPLQEKSSAAESGASGEAAPDYDKRS